MNQRVADEALAAANADKLARERYLANPPTEPEVYVARHVLIRVNPRSEADARALAEEVLSKLRAGDDFATIESKFSDDDSAANGLLEGPLEKFDPAFSEALRQLDRSGDLSPVVRSSFGFHVIELVEKRAGRTVPFEQVEQQLVAEVSEAVAQQAVRAFHDRINSGNVIANDEIMREIYANPGALKRKRSAPDAKRAE